MDGSRETHKKFTFLWTRNVERAAVTKVCLYAAKTALVVIANTTSYILHPSPPQLPVSNQQPATNENKYFGANAEM